MQSASGYLRESEEIHSEPKRSIAAVLHSHKVFSDLWLLIVCVNLTYGRFDKIHSLKVFLRS
jgi:hypothetical protein